MGHYIADRTRLRELLDEERGKGKKIIFGNGCFDLLHVGHVRYLQGAKALGDILVVAVNDDSSLVTIGKRQAPVTPLFERVEILCALSCVDYVTSFSEPTVSELLLELRPHIQAKGTDYTVDTVPERDVVRSYGGDVAIVGDEKNHSTRDIIKQVRKMGSQ
ncbi:MAG TPA: D-glycero-beta-D-manno-heptose 1-phosphate adenylyltransferase [Deltaproteobacteria bacterium]|nr:D-glycero-beta-D-manno-heptose 1-phosphate adenylyltransferase [Deltaproteobacteria bacterium]